MAFLNNDSSILLDSVLTDEGRRRLAAGTFKVAKFACLDGEINYASYNKNHASGSAYYDLEILQTPVLEAFSNNSSYSDSKLLSIPRTNLLYLPMLKVNENWSQATKMNSAGAFFVAADKNTEDSYLTIQGIMAGESVDGATFIRVDQGLDSSEVSPAFALDSDLVETQYILEIDNRLGKVVSTNGTLARVSFIDDDNMASYFLSLGTDSEFVSENTERRTVATQTIAGPRGTILQFQLQASLDINTSDYWFSTIGSTTTLNDKNGTSQTIKYIDSYIKIIGGTTGYSVSIPVRWIKL